MSGHPRTSFWFPTSTDRFNPDFVVLLQDGRIFIIEYKGGDRVTTDNTKEKRNLGELGAAKSDGAPAFSSAQRKFSPFQKEPLALSRES